MVVIDYFTKWVVAEMLATIMVNNTMSFLGRTSSAGLASSATLSQTMEDSSTLTTIETGVGT